MAGDPSSGRAPHDQYGDSQYPPLPGEEDDRPRAIPQLPRSQMASGAVTLPSIQDRPDMYNPQGPRPWDPRGSGYGPSPTSSNGYPPPPGAASMPPGSNYSPSASGVPYPPPGSHQPYPLPPVHAHPQDPRTAYPADPRAQGFYAQPGSFNGGYDYGYRQDRGPPGPYPPEYARGGPAGAVMQTTAPRQRTSIACKYCRRRKIRCSGYANSPGGKCTNCIKMNQECVFQPVSNSTSTAFVPVSALPGGVPPGTQLFGAYGQPLAGGGPAPGSLNYPQGQTYQASTPQYDQQHPSPTGSNSSYWEDRQDGSRRRQRMSDDDHAVRLPPPNTFPEEGFRRRSPSSSSPNHLQPFPPTQAQPGPHGFDNRTPPPRGSPSGPPASNASGSSVMNLENIMSSSSSGNDIDSSMLGRLNRRAK
ncbi:hypothetical protein GGR57DRAFT_315252 [Xylariaceae sp. FL1272]|nr:hypothetical protein GGR57DRAFT_315252 [Xylariaceae sp. FL1272]